MTTPRYTELAEELASDLTEDRPPALETLRQAVAALRQAADLEREVAELRGRLAEAVAEMEDAYWAGYESSVKAQAGPAAANQTAPRGPTGLMVGVWPKEVGKDTVDLAAVDQPGAETDLERLTFLWSRLVEEVRRREDGFRPIMWPDRSDAYWCGACDSYHRSDIPRNHAGAASDQTGAET